MRHFLSFTVLSGKLFIFVVINTGWAIISVSVNGAASECHPPVTVLWLTQHLFQRPVGGRVSPNRSENPTQIRTTQNPSHRHNGTPAPLRVGPHEDLWLLFLAKLHRVCNKSPCRDCQRLMHISPCHWALFVVTWWHWDLASGS